MVITSSCLLQTEVSTDDSVRIWSKAVQAFPNIADAEVLGEVVGLRPHRHTPRYFNNFHVFVNHLLKG